jgi:hypothetical protein
MRWPARGLRRLHRQDRVLPLCPATLPWAQSHKIPRVVKPLEMGNLAHRFRSRVFPFSIAHYCADQVPGGDRIVAFGDQVRDCGLAAEEAANHVCAGCPRLPVASKILTDCNWLGVLTFAVSNTFLSITSHFGYHLGFLP